MVIYEIKGDFDHYDTCHVDVYACIPLWKGGYDFAPTLDGSVQGDSWWPRVMKRDNDHPLGSYVSCLQGGILILERKALALLRPIMGDVEVLPIICDFGDYIIANVLTVIDCIDYEKSKYIRYNQIDPKVVPRIMCFENYAFHPEAIQNRHIFRTTEEPSSCIFVDDVFVDKVNAVGLTGFKFKKVWESDNS